MKRKDIAKKVSPILTAEKLHGHTKITICEDGGKMVYEEDNIVTNALADIFKCDYDGLIEIEKFMPLRNLFGGIMCFQERLDEEPADYWPPAQTVNPLIAHAGQTPHATGSTRRGNPNGALSGEITGGYRFVYDFATSQGNGRITSVCMTSSQAGDCGIVPFDDSLPLASRSISRAVDNVNRLQLPTSYSAALAQIMPYKIDGDNHTATAAYINGTDFYIYTLQHNFTKFVLNLGPGEWKVTDTVQYSLQNTYGSSATFAEDDAYYYVFEPQTQGGSVLLIDKIDKTTGTVTSTVATLAGVNLYKKSIAMMQTYPAFPYDTYDGKTYVYLPTSSSTFARVDLNNTVDVTILSSNLTGWDSYHNTPAQYSAFKLNRELYLSCGCIINGNNVYGLSEVPALPGTVENTTERSMVSFASNQGRPIAWASSWSSGTSSWWHLQGPAIIYPYLATINSLNQAVTKQATQTMQIQYDITAV